MVLAGDCDHQGHMNAVQFYAKFDMAGCHMIHRSGITRPRLDNLGLVDVRVEIDFVSKMVVNDPLVTESGVEKLGKSALTCRSVMRHGTTAVVTARLRCTTVCFDLAKRVKKTIPGDIRTHLATLVIDSD